MSQRVQHVVRTDEWQAEYRQINMQWAAQALYGMAAWHTHTHSPKLWPAKKLSPHALQLSPGRSCRQGLSGQAGRQWAKQSTQLAVITSCALGQRRVEAGGVKETEEAPA